MKIIIFNANMTAVTVIVVGTIIYLAITNMCTLENLKVVHIVLKHVTHLVEICEGIYAG
jgi:hypothetical protein